MTLFCPLPPFLHPKILQFFQTQFVFTLQPLMTPPPRQFSINFLTPRILPFFLNSPPPPSVPPPLVVQNLPAAEPQTLLEICPLSVNLELTSDRGHAFLTSKNLSKIRARMVHILSSFQVTFWFSSYPSNTRFLWAHFYNLIDWLENVTDKRQKK
jgi:hypothetical protein